MEDRHIIALKLPTFSAFSLFGIFDGHGGSVCLSLHHPPYTLWSTYQIESCRGNKRTYCANNRDIHSQWETLGTHRCWTACTGNEDSTTQLNTWSGYFIHFYVSFISTLFFSLSPLSTKLTPSLHRFYNTLLIQMQYHPSQHHASHITIPFHFIPSQLISSHPCTLFRLWRLG